MDLFGRERRHNGHQQASFVPKTKHSEENAII